MANYKTAIHWFRRDLRLTDNTALLAASSMAEEVVPVYILSEWRTNHAWTGPGRQQFLCGCLDSLSKNLKTIGGQLVTRAGADQVAELEQLIKDVRAEAIFYNRDPDPYGRDVEIRVLEMARNLGIDVHHFKDCVLHEPGEILTGSGDPYRVFTPYSKNWFNQPKTEKRGKPRSLNTRNNTPTEGIPNLNHWKLDSPDLEDPLPPGEKAGRDLLKKKLSGDLLVYEQKRDRPDLEVGSRLGAHLRWGTVSIREVYHRTTAARENAEQSSQRQSLQTFLQQLAWREFYMAILGNWPEVLDKEFNPKWRGLFWEDPEKHDALERWKNGETGFPIVDAGMRQLKETGYMHNRVRMIAAMFLTKDLHIDWREGERHFNQHLLDGEIANNNGGWQWSAGTGADAAPYFRIQNPWTQTERHDPEGAYIHRWVPELENVEIKNLAKPPREGSHADDYPEPIVDHSEERERTMDIFKKHASQQED